MTLYHLASKLFASFLAAGGPREQPAERPAPPRHAAPPRHGQARPASC